MFFKVVGRLTAKFFRGIGKFFFSSYRYTGKHPIGAFLVLLVLAGIGVFLYRTDVLGLTTGNFLGGNANSTVVTPQERKLEPDGKSNEFLNAVKDANAGNMYALLSDDYKKLLKQRGITGPKIMQDLMNEKLEDITKQNNTRLTYRFTYIIGTRYSDGSVEDDYQGTIESKSARTPLEFVIKVKNGKIIDIQTTEPVTIAALGTNKTESNEAAQLGTFTRNSSGTADKLMSGLTTFNADLVWETLTDTYKQQLTSRGVTRDTIAKLFDEEIKAPNEASKDGPQISYDGYAFQETINFPNGVSVNTYVAILSIKDNPKEYQYLIVLDPSNRVIRLGNTGQEDPILAAMLGRGRGQ